MQLGSKVMKRAARALSGRAAAAAKEAGTYEARVVAGGGGVELVRDGSKAVVHPLWLRERTQDPRFLHIESAQRLFECADLVGKSGNKVAEAHVDGQQLRVHFADGVHDNFSLDELWREIENPWALSTRTKFSGKEKEDFDRIPVDLGFPKVKLWGSDLDGKFELALATHKYEDMLASEKGKLAFIDSLLTYGVAVIQDSPVSHAEYIKLLKSFGRLRTTNWGEWFEVVAKPTMQTEESASLTDAAYSNLGIPLHVDGPYNENPLLFQVLQCLKQSKVGGESTLSDGLAAAVALRRSNPDAFEVLCRTPVRFRYHDAAYDLLTERPMITVDQVTGEPSAVYFSGRLDITPLLPSLAVTESFYHAKAAFLRELHSPERLLNFKLRERDTLVFSNSRLLHGRSAFSTDVQDLGGVVSTPEAAARSRETVAVAKKDGLDLDAVARHLRGCYMEGVDSKYRVTKRNVAKAALHTAGAPRGARGMHTASPAERRMPSPTEGLCSFNQLADCTERDVEIMNELYQGATTGAKLADRALGLLKLLGRVQLDHGHSHANPNVERLGLDDAHLGCKIDLFEHGLQTASRCLEAGMDEEIIVAGLLHDLGELLSPCNHGEVSASLLRPFVSPHVSWMLAHHEVFQMKYYQFNDRERRQVYNNRADAIRSVMGVSIPKEIDHFAFTADFCERFDQKSFDPTYSSSDLSKFEPMVRRVFERKPFWHTPGHPKKGAVTGN